MSSIKLSPNASGTGIFTVAAPNSNTDRTLTLPDATGTIAIQGGTGVGKVLQVVQGTYSIQVDTTSGSYVDTGLTASITPTSSSSKVLVLVAHQISISSSTGYGNVQLLRGATSISVFGTNVIAGNSTIAVGLSVNYLDSPATTSSTTYKTQIQRTSGGGTFTSQQNGAMATMILMEIAA